MRYYKPEDFINDADYAVKPQVNFVRSYCPFYIKWNAMKRRVCAEEYKEKHPTYEHTTCCEDWLLFSNFKAWMENQPWVNMDLDKDLLISGNKLYSPDTCCFIPQRINSIFRDYSKKKLKGYPRGVYYLAANPELINKKRWAAKVSTLQQSDKYLGVYGTKEDAHRVWQLNKAESLEEIVDWWAFNPEINHAFKENIADCLLDKASKLRNDYVNGVESTFI